jgi:hypothetical protein
MGKPALVPWPGIEPGAGNKCTSFHEGLSAFLIVGLFPPPGMAYTASP